MARTWGSGQRGIFINYRGVDSGAFAALLHHDLAHRFGRDLVFLDSESIGVGADWADQILGRLRSCRVVLAVVGPGWLDALDPAGRRRIDNPADWIRRELATAYAAGLTVIPITSGGATVPVESALPPDIAVLSRNQGLPLRHREATPDLNRIADALVTLDPALRVAAARRRRRRWSLRLAAVAAVLLAVATGGAVWLANQPATTLEVQRGLPAQRSAGSACPQDFACLHPGPNLTGPWTNRVTDTNSDLTQYAALALVESVENDRSSCPITLYSEKDFQGYSVTLRPAEWANLAGTVWYHHIGSNRWC